MKASVGALSFALGIWVCAVFDPSAAHAEGMRCGHRLVSEGDPPYRVESRCGPPLETRSWTELRSIRVRVGNVWVDRVVEVKYEQWTYDHGPDRLVRYVIFENGQLVKVNTGHYGEGAG